MARVCVFLEYLYVFRHARLLDEIGDITDIPTHVLVLRVVGSVFCLHFLVLVGVFRHASAAAGRRLNTGGGE